VNPSKELDEKKGFISQMSDGAYTEEDFVDIRTNPENYGEAALKLANTVLAKLNMPVYERFNLKKESNSVQAAKVLLKNALYLYPAEGADKAAEATAVPAPEATVQPAGESVQEDRSLRVVCGDWVVTDEATEGRDVTVLGSKQTVAIELNVHPKYLLGDEVEFTAQATADGQPVENVNLLFQLNGKGFAAEGGKIPAEEVNKVGAYALRAILAYEELGISAKGNASFRVIMAPVWGGAETKAVISDAPEQVGQYVCFENMSSLFTDPNGEGIESVTFVPDEQFADKYSYTQENGALAITASVVSGEGETISGKLVAVNKEGLSTEQTVSITLNSIPALVSAMKLDAVAEPSAVYSTGDMISVELKLNNVNQILLNTMRGMDVWAEHIQVSAVLNDGEAVVLEGSLEEGWRYEGIAAEDGVLKAWLHTDVIDVDKTLPAAFEMKWTVEVNDPASNNELSILDDELLILDDGFHVSDTATPAPGIITPTPSIAPTEKPDDVDVPINMTAVLIIVGAIAAVVVGAVLIVVWVKKPAFKGYLVIDAEQDDVYEGSPVFMTDWGKKTVAFKQIISQTGLPPLSALLEQEVMDKLKFKPAQNGICVICESDRLETVVHKPVLKDDGKKFEITIAGKGIKIIVRYQKRIG